MPIDAFEEMTITIAGRDVRVRWDLEAQKRCEERVLDRTDGAAGAEMIFIAIERWAKAHSRTAVVSLDDVMVHEEELARCLSGARPSMRDILAGRWQAACALLDVLDLQNRVMHQIWPDQWPGELEHA